MSKKQSKNRKHVKPTEPQKTAATGTSKRRKTVLIAISVLVVVIAVGATGLMLMKDDPGPVSYTYEILTQYPHSTEDFTQGLFMYKGYLFESTGLRGKSAVMKKDLRTGQAHLKIDLPEQFFGEGITPSSDRIVQLTWESGIGFVYDINTLQFKGRFQYEGQGWGITDDGASLIMSNGSHTLTFLDRNTFQPFRRVNVHDGDRLVKHLNELEYIDGEVYANVWGTDTIAIINPEDGNVTGWLDLTGLIGMYSGRHDVLNGIAVNDKTGNLLVTGKLWPKIFEIKLIPR